MSQSPSSDPVKVAIVTGSGQGIGKSIARRLARDGFAVAVCDIESSLEKSKSVVEEIASFGGRAKPFVVDVTLPESVKALVEEVVVAFGRLDVAVANAGIVREESVLESTADQWDQVFAVNTRGVFLTWQAAAAQIIAQGTGGRLIAAASQVAFRASSDIPAYSASKFAVRGLTQAASQEFAKFGITVNSYAPGIVNTPMWDETRDRFEQLIPSIPLGRAQEPDDVAAIVSFLASADSAYMTGQTLIADGGMVFA